MSEYFPGLIEGRIVHYVLPDGEHRGAFVTAVRRDASQELQQRGCCNVRVMLDETNDVHRLVGDDKLLTQAIQRNWRELWIASAVFDDSHKPGTLHWPEKEKTNG